MECREVSHDTVTTSELAGTVTVDAEEINYSITVLERKKKGKNVIQVCIKFAKPFSFDRKGLEEVLSNYITFHAVHHQLDNAHRVGIGGKMEEWIPAHRLGPVQSSVDFTLEESHTYQCISNKKIVMYRLNKSLHIPQDVEEE